LFDNFEVKFRIDESCSKLEVIQLIDIILSLFSFELMIAFLCLFICAIVQGYSGFGGGLMIVPIMAILFSPITGIGLVAIPFFFGMMIILPRALADVNWREVMPLATISSIAIIIGQIFLLSADPKNLKITMGIFIVCFAVLFLRRWRYTGKRNFVTRGIVGATAGGITGTFGIPGGPVAVMYYLSAPIEPAVQRANILITGFLNTVVFLGGFIFHGVYERVSMVESGILVPAFIVGSILGQYLFKVAPAKWFSKATSIMLLIIGLVIIVL
jgi:hypothetical protein